MLEMVIPCFTVGSVQVGNRQIAFKGLVLLK
jgi:hypothetical protein